MLIPDKNIYLNEVYKFNSAELKDKLTNLYDHLQGVIHLEDANTVVKEVISELFNTSYSKDVLIPLNFLESSVGVVLFKIMYGMNDKLYTVKELIELTKNPEKPNGYTRQYIKAEIDRGNLKATLKNNNYFIEESEANRYLKTKGLK